MGNINKKKVSAKKKIIIGCSMCGVAVAGLSTGLILGLGRCNTKIDLTNTYFIPEMYDNIPTKDDILEFVKGKNNKMSNMVINDFDWNGPNKANTIITVKQNNNYKGIITVNYETRANPTDGNISGLQHFTTIGVINTTYIFNPNGLLPLINPR
ncbi:hypothetical protein FACS189459_6130 [Bacilli bacterium]|nr:hypothetical protein FACS189459_6130 [Bacilli bacterium]GHU52010.1 hypothetical protein FACS189496_1400 [Bacilli bacterium]